MEETMAKLVVVKEFSWEFRRGNVNRVRKGTVLELNEAEGQYMYPGSVLLIGPEILKELFTDGVVVFRNENVSRD